MFLFFSNWLWILISFALYTRRVACPSFCATKFMVLTLSVRINRCNTSEQAHVRIVQCTRASFAASAVFGYDLGSGALPPYLGGYANEIRARRNTLGIISNGNYIPSNHKTLSKRITAATLFYPQRKLQYRTPWM